jgi:hypothetical protein
MGQVAVQVCEARNDRDRSVRSPAACLPPVGWADAGGASRPPKFTLGERREIKKIAKSRPAELLSTRVLCPRPR